jgi:putative flippase GtrA
MLKYSECIKYLKQVGKFGAVGIVIWIFNYTCFEYLYSFLKWDYRIAVSIAYVLSVSLHFVLNKRVTFNIKKQSGFQSELRYLMMLLINYLVVMALTYVTVEIAKLNPRFLFVFSPFITSGLSFILMKFFVFKHNLIVEKESNTGDCI